MTGILLDDLELQDEDNGYWFVIIAGGLDDLGEWVGTDDDVPGASGMDAGKWRNRSHPLKLHGVVEGSGSTAAARRVSYRARMDALVAKMQPSDTHDVTIGPPNEGLDTDETAVLADCRPQSIVGPPAVEDEVREVTLTLKSIASSPTWTVTEESSS